MLKQYYKDSCTRIYVHTLCTQSVPRLRLADRVSASHSRTCILPFYPSIQSMVKLPASIAVRLGLTTSTMHCCAKQAWRLQQRCRRSCSHSSETTP